jgi:hypothetical protein
MSKFLAFSFLFFLSLNTYAQNCASNIEELRVLTGNSHLPLKWIEDDKNPLVLAISNGDNQLSLRMTLKGEFWADVGVEVCQSGEHFVAKVKKITWGSAAPRFAKSANIKELTIKLPYHSLLKVKVSLMSIEFSPL